jgi:RES domain
VIHDPQLIDYLSSLGTREFEGDVFRATRRNLEPNTPSTSGGRWAQRDGAAVLYTSLQREGALAEIAHHWGSFTPRPTKSALIHTLNVKCDRTLKLIRADLSALGIGENDYSKSNYVRTQEIGETVSFIGCDGLIAPSARWPCDNLILFNDNLALDVTITIKHVEEVDWQVWAEENVTAKP